MRLQQEVKHRSEDIVDGVLSDALKAIGRRVRVSHDYEKDFALLQRLVRKERS